MVRSNAVMRISGKKHGSEIGRRGNESKWLQEIWRNGKRHGVDKLWHKNGTRMSDTEWVDGMRTGESERKQHGAKVRTWGGDGLA